MTKSRLYIYIVAGLYLAYNGFGLAKNAVTQRPENCILYLVIGVLFIAIGGFFAIKSALKVSKGNYADSSGSAQDELKEDTEEDSGDR